MTTTTLRPNGTTTLSGTVTGAADGHTALNDNSDASYVSASSAGGNPIGIFQLGTVTLPAGAVTKTYQARLRGRANTGETIIQAYLNNPDGSSFDISAVGALFDTTIGTASGTVKTATLTQAQIDGMQVQIRAFATDARAIEFYWDLTYALVPVTAITYPTGAPTITTTNQPTFTWTHTPGSDGGAQTFYEVKVFTDAQIAAGGFDALTSTPYWTSGVVVGSATSQLSGPLATGDSYGVYVRTAQTINGAAQWSVFDSETFTITVTTSDISAITASPLGERILINVDRSGSAWDFVEVQRSTDSGTTWEYVRGGQYVPPAVTTAFSTGDANNFDIQDWEVAPSTSSLYRARATRIVSGLPIAGEWVQSTPAVAWSSAEAWLKAPDDPTLNRTVKLSTVPALGFTRRRAVLPVLGRANPVVVSDVLSGVSDSTLTIQTADDTEMNAVFALLCTNVLLFHPPPGWQYGSRYISVGKVVQRPIDPRLADTTFRRFEVEYAQVDAPADPLAGAGG